MDSDWIYDVDPATGLEYHTWKGTRMFLCPRRWEGTNVRCAYESHDSEKVRAHMSDPHNRTGKHAVTQVSAKAEVPVTEEVKPEFGNVEFAKEKD